ncbi:MAG: glycosyltransferase [Chitinophagaceae bacterium]|nr:glycosyltransferase [Chitinophagaceae bacterium]
MEKHLHIICFTVPYPADYGGVYDLFYKLEALKKNNIKIHLHCFDYGRGKQEILNSLCESVNYYERNISKKYLFSNLPFIVKSRQNKDLINNLKKDRYPILMEGIHATAVLLDPSFNKRVCIVRLHNIEHRYYYELSKSTSIFDRKKWYYLREAYLLKKHEAAIAEKAKFITVSLNDKDVWAATHPGSSVDYVPVFLPPWNDVQSKPGFGTYCLYHGDLSIGLNAKAVNWLLKKVYKNLDVRIVIAGKNPSKKLIKKILRTPNATLVPDLPDEKLNELIQQAHVHLLPAFSDTGIKLKLLHALFIGRHCIVNSIMIKGTKLEEFCHVATTADEWRQRIEQLYHQPFFEQENIDRKKNLSFIFNNNNNSKQLIDLIWDEKAKPPEESGGLYNV